MGQFSLLKFPDPKKMYWFGFFFQGKIVLTSDIKPEAYKEDTWT